MVRPPPVPPNSPPSASTPEKVPEALLSVSVLAPSETPPVPFSVTIEAPAVAPEMSNAPLSITFDESAIEPAPLSNRNPAASIVVGPVYVLTPALFSDPDWSSKLPLPEIGIVPPTPPPPKFSTSAPLSMTPPEPPIRNVGLPAPHCSVAPLSILTVPPIALPDPANTTAPATTSTDPLPLNPFGDVTEPE